MANPRKILIVDDEEDVITYLSAVLSDAGYEVCTARNGNEALQQARDEAPDLISLDITMPEKSGVGFYRAMREDPDLKSIPIMIVTGVSSPYGSGDFKGFLSSRRNVPPPDGFMEKPVEAEFYLRKVAEILGDR